MFKPIKLTKKSRRTCSFGVYNGAGFTALGPANRARVEGADERLVRWVNPDAVGELAADLGGEGSAVQTAAVVVVFGAAERHGTQVVL